VKTFYSSYTFTGPTGYPESVTYCNSKFILGTVFFILTSHSTPKNAIRSLKHADCQFISCDPFTDILTVECGPDLCRSFLKNKTGFRHAPLQLKESCYPRTVTPTYFSKHITIKEHFKFNNYTSVLLVCLNVNKTQSVYCGPP
jgi:hypothetical protein